MLPDDLVRRVALESLRTSIPARHSAGWIQHVDGVIDDAFDQQPETLLALCERFLVQRLTKGVASLRKLPFRGET